MTPLEPPAATPLPTASAVSPSPLPPADDVVEAPARPVRASGDRSAPVRIEVATADDCQAIAEVHVRSWQQAYRELLPGAYLARLSIERREAVWRESLARGEPQVLVARSGERVIGFVAFGRSRDADAPPGCAEVWALYLAPGAWSQGTGRRLWLAAWARLLDQGFRAATLWVLTGNTQAIGFYEAAGFETDITIADKALEIGGTPLVERRLRLRGESLPTAALAGPTGPG